MKNNYHSHTFRCKHAVGDVEDYAAVAVEKGLIHMGVTEHTPLPDNRWPFMRFKVDDMDDYIDAINKASTKHPELKILKGMECDYAKEYESFFRDELLGKWNLDYLITGAHYFIHNGAWESPWTGTKEKAQLKNYVEYIVKTMETGLFAFVAHPDAFGCSYLEWDENATSCAKYLFEAAAQLNVPFEINSYGFRKEIIQTASGKRFMYPWEPFWEVASQYDINVIINSDAHRPEDIYSNIEDAYAIANKFNLKIVDTLKLYKDK